MPGIAPHDVQIKNAEDAGAVAAIVTIAPIGFPIPPDSPLIELLGGAGFNTISPSGQVTEPITIPSIVVEAATGDAIQNNIVNDVKVTLGGAEVLSQERSNFSLVRAEEWDPDFNGSGLLFFLQSFATSTNNLAEGSVTVLRDRDGDGSSDLDDQCPTDKDAVMLQSNVDEARGLLRKIRQLEPTGNPRRDRRRRRALKMNKRELRGVLNRIVDCVGQVFFSDRT